MIWKPEEPSVDDTIVDSPKPPAPMSDTTVGVESMRSMLKDKCIFSHIRAEIYGGHNHHRNKLHQILRFKVHFIVPQYRKFGICK